MPNALNVPAWKLYAITRKGRFTISVGDAFRHMSEWKGIVLLGESSVVKSFVVSRIEELSDGAEYVLYTQNDERHWSVPASKHLQVVKSDLTPMDWTIRERNEWIIERQGLHEGMLVTYDDSRTMPDGETEVPAFAPGLLAQINDNGTVAIHWLGYGVEYEVDPSNMEPAEDFPFNPPPYTVITEKDKELERLREQVKQTTKTMPVYVEAESRGGINPPAKTSDAGHDLRSAFDYVIVPGTMEVIQTGTHIELPAGHCGLIVGRSGLNLKGVICLVGLVDEGYHGEIKAALFTIGNHGNLVINAGDRVAQLLILPYAAPEFKFIASADQFSASERGNNGFGSTGTK